MKKNNQKMNLMSGPIKNHPMGLFFCGDIISIKNDAAIDLVDEEGVW